MSSFGADAAIRGSPRDRMVAAPRLCTRLAARERQSSNKSLFRRGDQQEAHEERPTAFRRLFARCNFSQNCASPPPLFTLVAPAVSGDAERACGVDFAYHLLMVSNISDSEKLCNILTYRLLETDLLVRIWGKRVICACRDAVSLFAST